VLAVPTNTSGTSGGQPKFVVHTPSTLARLVASHPAVKEAVVVGRPDPVLGQGVLAFVTLTACAKYTVSDILDKVSQRSRPSTSFLPRGRKDVDAQQLGSAELLSI
jgi:acyl-CoA synthetase (AMP-forming)/AMP-acid ligase II